MAPERMVHSLNGPRRAGLRKFPARVSGDRIDLSAVTNRAHRTQLGLRLAFGSFISSIGELRNDDRGENAENHDNDENLDQGEASFGSYFVPHNG